MTYVIAGACTDTLDRSCIEVCPVDCIYEGDRKMYIHPVECVDCGACEPVCPVNAINYAEDVPDDSAAFIADNARFFNEPLPGRDAPLGLLGGAMDVGRIGVDTPLVAGLPAADPT